MLAQLKESGDTLFVKRAAHGVSSTGGELYFGDMFIGHTIEDQIRAPGVKIPKVTAIAPGKYKATWHLRLNKDGTSHYKPNFYVPMLMDVPQFTGVLIHPGGSKDDSEGCILLCNELVVDNYGNYTSSYREALDVCRNFFETLRAAHPNGFWVEISNPNL